MANEVAISGSSMIGKHAVSTAVELIYDLIGKSLRDVARPERFELPTFWFVVVPDFFQV